METIRSNTSTPDEKAYAFALIDAMIRTQQEVASAGEARLTYTRRFKASMKILTGEERVAARLVYSRCLDTIAADRGGNVVDGLLSALEDKWTRNQHQRRCKNANSCTIKGIQASTM
jgi:hypothetical protein